MSTNFYERVSKIQKELKAPKSQFNKFGNYSYRNSEDILEAVKPLLNGLVMTVNDDVVEVAGRIYIKSTATITDGTNSVSNSAFAREPDEQKGMSSSQISGATSSYARKYCLNGLLLIDDTKDADSDTVTAASKGVTAGLAKVETKAVEAKTTVTMTKDLPALTVKVETVEKPVAKTTTPKAGGWASARAKTTTKTESTDY